MSQLKSDKDMPVNFKRNEALQLRKEVKRGKRRQIWHKKWIIEYQSLAFEWVSSSCKSNVPYQFWAMYLFVWFVATTLYLCVLLFVCICIIFIRAYNIQCDCWRVSLFAMHADTTPKFSERTKHSLVFRLLNWNNSASDIHSLFTKVFFCYE